MWSLSNSSLIGNVQFAGGSSPISKLKPSTPLTGDAIFCEILNDTTLQPTVVTEGDTPHTYTFGVDNQIPIIITNVDTVFVRAIDVTNPQNGEFVFDGTKIILFSEKPITQVSYVASNTSFRTLAATGISGLSGLPIVGSISINDNFQDHPSGSMTLICDQRDLGSLRYRFSTGTFVSICGFAFIVNGFTEDISSSDTTAIVNVSLRGKWEMYANKPIALNNPNSSTSGDFQDPSCQIGYVDPTKQKYVSINALAGRVGATVTGITFQIEVPNDSDNATTTIANELGNYLDIEQSFVDYSSPQAIICRKINAVQSWNYSHNDLLEGKFSTSINRLPEEPITKGASVAVRSPNYSALVPTTIAPYVPYIQAEDVNNIPKPTIYNFTTPDIFNNAGNVVNEPTQQSTEQKFQLRKVEKRKYTTGDSEPTIPPPHVVKLTSLDQNTDRSGASKTSIYREEEDGMPILEITRRYAFAYTAFDITKFKFIGEDKIPYLEGDPSQFWQLVEETYKNYIYDEKTGYLLGYDIRGKKYMRAKLEGDDLYTQSYQIALQEGEEVSNYQTALYNTYKFEWVPVYGAKRYALVRHKDYYKQFDKEEQYIKKCNKDGTSYWEQNPNYIEPMFAIAETEEYTCFISIPNPDNLLREGKDPFQPDVMSGTETFNRQKLTILPSKNTKIANYELGEPPEEDKYLTFVSNFTAQDPQFAAVVEETSESESTGVPPVHTRKPPKYELVDVNNDKNKQKKNDKYRYVIWTQPYNGGYPRTGSYNFEKAKNIQDVINAVTNQLQIDDMRSTLSSSCSVPLNLSLRSGDKVTVNLKGSYYYRRVMGCTHSLIIEGINEYGVPLITSSGTSLQLGMDRNISVQNKKEEVPSPRSSDSDKPTGLFIDDTNFTLGSLLSSDLPRRGRVNAQ
ncbi:hypothetical protein [Scytonema sp. NUACC26]|uniref:hypothetical protein n=1 Tax=Scytonema sp. NUACC26 TaxID=3140176 RepID=UPI0034DC7D72